METTRIQNSQTERIEVVALDSSGSPVTGLSDVLLAIRRISDDFYFDFNDSTFKGSGWTTRQQQMSELDATNDAGLYTYDFNTAGLSDDNYQMRSESATAVNFPKTGELKVGDYVDFIFDWDAANTELSAIPTATSGLKDMLKHVLQYFRQGRQVEKIGSGTATETMFKEDGTTALGTRSITDNGTISSMSKMS